MTTSEAPAFERILTALKKHVPSQKTPYELSLRGLERASAPAEPWLAFAIKVAISRRKGGTAETPDGLVFTATQLHNYLNCTASEFGAACPYADAVFLALFLTGETKMKHTLESVKHFYGGVIYDEEDEVESDDESTDYSEPQTTDESEAHTTTDEVGFATLL